MKSKILLISVVLVLITSFVISGCAAPAPAPAPTPAPAPAPTPTPAPTPAEPIRIKAMSFCVNMTPTDICITLNLLMDEINKRAKGELIVDYVGSVEAIPHRDQPVALRDGVIDMLLTSISFYSGVVGPAQLTTLSELSSVEERQSKAYDLLVEEHKKANFFYLGRVPTDLLERRLMLTKHRPETPYDLAGLRCGISSTADKTMAEALGMGAIQVRPPDRYTALERGMVDVLTQGYGSAGHWKLYEVLGFIIDHGYSRDNATLILNLDTWNKLPRHLQDLIRDSYVAIEPVSLRLRQEDEEINKKKFIDAGIELIKFSPADAKWFVDTISRAERERLSKLYPDIAPKLLQLLQK